MNLYIYLKFLIDYYKLCIFSIIYMLYVYMYPYTPFNFIFHTTEQQHIYCIAGGCTDEFSIFLLLIKFFEKIYFDNIINDNVIDFDIVNIEISSCNDIFLSKSIDYNSLLNLRLQDRVYFIFDKFKEDYEKYNNIIFNKNSIRIHLTFDVTFQKDWYFLVLANPLRSSLEELNYNCLYLIETSQRVSKYCLDFVLTKFGQ